VRTGSVHKPTAVQIRAAERQRGSLATSPSSSDRLIRTTAYSAAIVSSTHATPTAVNGR